jgi:dTDP-6-deoxy-L-talose 4-dehydrogenase (NAD+)
MAAEEGKKTFPFTTGKNKFDFISVQELGKMIVASSTQSEITGVINVSTGQPKSLAEQIEWYIKEHNWDIKLEYGAFPDRPYDSPGIWGDSTKIQQIMKNNKKD